MEKSGDPLNKLKGNRVRNYRLLIVLAVLLTAVFVGILVSWPPSRTPLEKPPLTPAPMEPDQDITSVITQKVEVIPGVQDAEVIVLNRIVLITLDVNEDMTARDIRQIKEQASNTAKGMGNVDEVLVTAHPSLMAELKAILSGEMPLENLEKIYESIRDQHL